MGFGWKHTAICMSASAIKSSYQQYDDIRHSLIGDSFNMFSFVIPAAALCRWFLPEVSYQHICKRMGLAPGYRNSLRVQCTLARRLQYGYGSLETNVEIEDLNKHLLSRTNHTGSDVRITTGEVLNPRAFPRQGLQAEWYEWTPVFRVQWQHKDHINLLELRSIMLSIQFQITHKSSSSMRVFHISDSYVSISVLCKGRTSSKQLSRILRQINAHLLAYEVYLIIGHIESTDNPTDHASRQLGP